MMKKNLLGFTVAAMIIAAGAAVTAADVQVIYSRAPNSPTSIVPGAVDLNGDPMVTQFRSMSDIWVSPDGSRFMLHFASEAGTDLANALLLGSGSTGSVILQEGRPFPGATGSELADSFSLSTSYPFNSNNEWAHSLRARGGSTNNHNKIVRFDAAGNGELRFVGGTVVGGASPYIGAVDVPANPQGDEIIGNSTAGIHLLNDGRIGWHDTTALGIHTSRRPILAYDAVKYRQVNVDPMTNLDGTDTFNMSAISSTGTITVFRTSPDGSIAVLRGNLDVDRNGSTIPATDPVVVVVNDRVRLQVGQAIPGDTIVPTAINQTSVAANNDWYARGTEAGGAWATRNGTVIAKTGDSLGGGGGDAWGTPTFFAIAGNSNGDTVIVGKSNNPDLGRDDVVVLNGQVILREGDPVSIDLDGDGTPDTAFIGRGNNALAAFLANTSVQLAPDGTVYVLAMLKDAGGADLLTTAFGSPSALIRITPDTAPPCLADFNGDTFVNPDDLADFITCFFLDVQFPGFCPAADFNNDTSRDPDDLADFITTFFLTVQQGGC